MSPITGADGEYSPAASGPSAANAAAQLNIQGRPGWRIVIGTLAVSYSAAPVGGRITVNDGAGNGIDLDITAAGATQVQLPDKGIRFNPGQAVLAVLAAGGAAVVGKINMSVRYVRVED